MAVTTAADRAGTGGGQALSHDDAPAYGLWSLVIINSAIFIFFAFTFFKPQTTRDWRSFGAFSAFLVALFTEMYGFYVGFILVMFGFLLQWPTLLTLAMFPVLVVMYVRLARVEEREALREFGDAHSAYVAVVPGFIPRLGSLSGRALRKSRDAADPPHSEPWRDFGSDAVQGERPSSLSAGHARRLLHGQEFDPSRSRRIGQSGR